MKRKENGMYELHVERGSAANPSSQFTREAPVATAQGLKDALQEIGVFAWDESYPDLPGAPARRWTLSTVFKKDVFSVSSKGGSDVPVIADAMLRAGIDGRIFAGANLSYPGEQIDSISVEEAMTYTADGPVTLMIRNLHPARRPLLLLRRDEDFERDGVPMTKECIRHESLIRLALRENDLLFDIGGGTGSVGIEAASLHPSVQVKIFEKNPKAVKLIRRNAVKNGVPHVTVLEGEASELLYGMEKPDCVFIGGSGGKLKEILEILHRKGRSIRYVITAVSLETLGEVTDLLQAYDTAGERIIQLAVTNVERTGQYRMMRALNPVFLISFTL